MRIPALPATVRLIPEAYQEKNKEGEPTGVPLADAPVGVFRPITGMEQAAYLDAVRRDGLLKTQAVIANDKLVTWENVHVGEPAEPFDPDNPAHRAAISADWWIDCGRELLSRIHLKDFDAGKSS